MSIQEYKIHTHLVAKVLTVISHAQPSSVCIQDHTSITPFVDLTLDRDPRTAEEQGDSQESHASSLDTRLHTA